MNLREVKRAVRSLTVEQLVRLDDLIHELLRGAVREGPNSGEKPRRSRILYVLENVRCGKKNCKCSRGELHGPYWYAYWTEGGKTRSEYVGKKLPRGVKKT